MQLIQQCGRDCLRVADIQELVGGGRAIRKAGDAGVSAALGKRVYGRFGARSHRDRDAIVLGRIKINLAGIFVDVVGGASSGEKLPAGRRRDEARSDKGLGHGIDLCGINDGLSRQCRVGLKIWMRHVCRVAGTKRARRLIADQEARYVGIGAAIRRLREVAIQLRRRVGTYCDSIQQCRLTLPLVSEEEENAVFHDRTADRATELTALQHGTRLVVQIIKEVIGVEGIVSQVLKKTSVHLIGARLGHHADCAAAVAAIFRRIVVAQDAELGDGIGIRIKHDAVAGYRVVRASIEQITHCIGAASSHGELTAAVASFGRRYDARLRQCQIQNIAAIQRQILDRRAGDRTADRGIHRFNLRGLRLHLHSLGDRANLQTHVDAQGLAYGELLGRGGGFVEARDLDRN